MDFLGLKSKIYAYASKYKYVAIVLLLGILLMLIPGKNEVEAPTITVESLSPEQLQSLEDRLEAILTNVSGAGNVKVMLSEEEGEETLYQTDTTHSQSENSTDIRTQTILVTDSNRNETGLIHQRNPPKYQGAIILAMGADNPAVKLAIVDAVSNVTGLGADKISVLKMQ